MRGYRVSNARLLVAALLGFLGSIVIAVDKFPPVHRRVSALEPWSSISYAVKDLSSYDYRVSDGAMVGYLEAGDRGFDDLVRVIRDNREDLEASSIVAVVQVSPMSLGGVPSRIVNVVVATDPNRAQPLTTDFILHEWIAKYRERFFLKWGLRLVTIGFFLGMLGRIEKKR